MEAVLISAGVVALAEFGDKTQLLAILLAARYRTPGPIILGILVATALNHGIAATLGNFLGDWLSGENLRWILAVSFIVIAVWMLLPENAHKPPKMFAGLGGLRCNAGIVLPRRIRRYDATRDHGFGCALS